MKCDKTAVSNHYPYILSVLSRTLLPTTFLKTDVSILSFVSDVARVIYTQRCNKSNDRGKYNVARLAYLFLSNGNLEVLTIVSYSEEVKVALRATESWYSGRKCGKKPPWKDLTSMLITLQV